MGSSLHNCVSQKATLHSNIVFQQGGLTPLSGGPLPKMLMACPKSLAAIISLLFFNLILLSEQVIGHMGKII